jgi:hypothetical protein
MGFWSWTASWEIGFEREADPKIRHKPAGKRETMSLFDPLIINLLIPQNTLK